MRIKIVNFFQIYKCLIIIKQYKIALGFLRKEKSNYVNF